MGAQEDSVRRVREYAAAHGLAIMDQLGTGMNGVVFAAERRTADLFSPRHSAIKACHRETEYVRERDVYLRLSDCAIADVRSCMVPQLLDYDDRRWILEMTIVTRPFCLDFGGAYLEEPPDFSEEVMADWQAEKIEQFGKYWPEARLVIAALEAHGIYMQDVHPGNISFEA